ncbi:MAG TPA: hypothetical protein VJL34_13220 [Anaerolineales bacterium]|nr:hypothetical protein [Anaerolineales bacterium]
MRTWSLKNGDPLALTLAADARLGPISYTDDQIWELSLGQGDPPALSVQTTYGLRARSMRLLPRFSLGDQSATDPASFHKEPRVLQFYPNYLRVGFAPFQGLDVIAEFWVPASQVLAGRLLITNQTDQKRQLRVDMVALLTPIEGERMNPVEIQAAPALAGRTSELAPVVFMTGGPKAVGSPYPALSLQLELPAGVSKKLTWAHAALAETQESFDLARETAARPWEAEIARLELLNSGQVEVLTGDPEWDAAFAFSQAAAYRLVVGPGERLPAASFVLARQPDQGYSARGDGTDYDHLWNGQPPLEADYLAQILLPASADLAQGLVRNFLATRLEDGSLDWKPGLAGQRSRLLATPILAHLSWKIYQVSQDRQFLAESFDPLVGYLHAWFDENHDRDGDGIPEWDHPMQAGYEDHPLFSRWHDWALGVDISTAESPSLCAFLYRECESLIRMAKELGRDEPLPPLGSLAGHLRTVLERLWDDEISSYRYWDRDTNYPTQGEQLASRAGSGVVPIERSFAHPVRLLIRLEVEEGTIPFPEFFIHGAGASGQHTVERLDVARLRWYLSRGSLTSGRVYSSLERIEIRNLRPGDLVSLHSVGYDLLDHTLLSPLCTGASAADCAARMVRETITDPACFGRPFGLPACPTPPEGADPLVCQRVYLPWNALVIEGLLAYGFRAEAARLVESIMAAIIRNLRERGAFYQWYDAESGMGLGERNELSGIAPLGSFLHTLGVVLISPWRIHVLGSNPFHWPVTVKYRGTTILCQKDKTVITFPNGQTVTVSGPESKIVSLEEERNQSEPRMAARAK